MDTVTFSETRDDTTVDEAYWEIMDRDHDPAPRTPDSVAGEISASSQAARRAVKQVTEAMFGEK